jgi:hypothetical protein
MSKHVPIKNLVLISLVPFMFACTKSKFSAVRTDPVPVPATVSSPRPDPTPVNTYNPPQQYTNNVEPYNNTDTDCNCHPQPMPEPRPEPYVPPQPAPYVPPRPVVQQPPPVYVEPKCDEVTYERPVYQGVQGINLWIVMDGSKSNLQERVTQLKAIIKAYDTRLARQIPFTVSVITGHSRKSIYSVTYDGPGRDTNKDFFFRSDAGEPSVIKFSPDMTRSQRQQAEQDLVNKMLGMKTDNSAGISDGGELLAYNLNAVFKAERLAWAKSKGALKDNYMLQIAFMTDENDICSPGKVPSTTVQTANGPIDREAVAYRDHCLGMDTGVTQFSREGNYSENNYSKTLYNNLARMNKTREVLLTGYLYTGQAPREGQNEFGNGLVQLIKKAGGRAYDLAQLNSEENQIAAAADLAEFNNTEANLYVKFSIKKGGKPVDASKFDMGQTQIYVGEKPVKSHPEGSVLVADGRIENKPVRIKYCNK